MSIFLEYDTLRKDKFDALMERFCPEWKLVIGPFGGKNWSKTGRFRDCYQRAAMESVLLPRLVKHIEELEAL
jgi:hypothetical protein